MKEGFLWYDSGPRSLQDKVKDAVERYRRKFGQDPKTCYINPIHLSELETELGLKVSGTTLILPNHLWLELPD